MSRGIISLNNISHGGGGSPQPEPEIVALIPKMTSNTTPSGIAFASSEWSSSYQAWKAFDQESTSDTDRWASVVGDNGWIAYGFIYPTVIKQLFIRGSYSTPGSIFQGSYDGVNWINIGDSFTVPAVGQTILLNYSNNDTAYSYYRRYLGPSQSGGNNTISNIQLYGYKVKNQPFYIYKDGVFSVGMDNPGDYLFTNGAYSYPATLQGNKFILPTATSNPANWECIGTSLKFNFTNYSVLKVRCKYLTPGANPNYDNCICLSSTKTTFGVESVISYNVV